MRKNLYASIAGVALVGSLAACTGSSARPSVAGSRPTASPTPTTSAPAPAPATSDSVPTGGDNAGGKVGGRGGGDGAPTTNGKPDRCHTANLRGDFHRFQWPGQAGAEGDGDLGLTNIGRTACVIYGFPGLQLIGGDGRSRPTTVKRDKRLAARAITLAPGATAWSLVTSRFTPLPDEENSQPLCGGKVTKLKVIPPDETTQLTISTDIGVVCEHGAMTASPFLATRP